MESQQTQMQPAEPNQPAPPRAPLSKRAGAMAVRVVLGIAGLGLLLGFFMPWLQLGSVMSVSGFGLVVSGGEMVEEMSGPHRGLLVVIPASALLLFMAAVRGHWIAVWLGIGTGAAVLAYGFYTLLRLFLDSTGMGMWIVVLSALLALGTGLFARGRA
ncbi:MAG: hypothetical protein PVI30_13480 [Myxococcales bacterium]|jgi:hypothetical protein